MDGLRSYQYKLPSGYVNKTPWFKCDIDELLETSDDEEHCKTSDIDKLLETTDDEEELGLQGLEDMLNIKKCNFHCPDTNFQ